MTQRACYALRWRGEHEYQHIGALEVIVDYAVLMEIGNSTGYLWVGGREGGREGRREREGGRERGREGEGEIEREKEREREREEGREGGRKGERESK